MADPLGARPERRTWQERYRLLVKLGRVINSTLDLRTVFRHAVRGVRALYRCERVSLHLVGAAGLTVDYTHGEGGIATEPPVAGPLAEWLAQARRPQVVPAVAAWPAAVGVPLFCRDRAAGVLVLATRDADAVRRWDLELLAELGTVLATAVDNAAAYGRIAELTARLERENRYLRSDAGSATFAGLVGQSPAMLAVRRAIEQVAPTDSTVLIHGETGVGKELVARAIHELSPRRERLLVAANCAALAPGVLTSELFGHEEGAFTGATRQRVGRFELASGGTLFLDEIAEVPADAQALLLRVLQERVLERVGGTAAISVDVRVLAATNRDLTASVRDGRFRADLFYRLNVFPVRVPPLRERREDVPALVEHFLATLGRRLNKPVSRAGARTLDLLTRYDWPGNVRELQNIIERGLIVSAGPTLEIDPSWLSAPADGAPIAVPLSQQERQAIEEALRQAGGRVYGPGGAAARLGLKPTTLYGKMRKHGIER